jgi:phage baseplate assembly protein W
MATVTQRSAFTDAASLNDISRDVRQFKDLDLFFSKNQGNGDVNKITGVEAVKRSIRNLVLLNFYEKPFNPQIGSDVRYLLFENMSPLTSVVLAEAIEDVIEDFEPRARLISVRAFPNFERNEYEVTIEFFVTNTPTELVDMTVFLEVLR